MYFRSLGLWAFATCMLAVAVFGNRGLWANEKALDEVLPANTAILLEITDVDQLLSYVRETPFFQDEKWLEALKIATDERFPLIHPDRLESLKLMLEELDSVADRIESITLIGQLAPNQRIPEFMILVKAPKHVKDELARLAGRLNRQLGQIDQPIEENNGVEDEPQESRSALASRVVEGWWVLAARESLIDSLENRFHEPPRSPLCKSRKYRTIMNVHRQGRDQDAFAVVGYADTSSVEFLFPEWSQDRWHAMKMQELPACGMRVELRPVHEIDDDQPQILVDLSVMFTAPRGGYGKVLGAATPIEFEPTVGLPIHEMSISEVDLWKQFEAIAEIEDGVDAKSESHHQKTESLLYDSVGLEDSEMSYRQKMEEVYRRRGLDLEEKLKFTKGKYLLRYVDQETDRDELLVVNRVVNPEFANRYVERNIEFLNGRLGPRGFDRLPSEHGILFASPASNRTPRREAYFCNEQWYLVGTLSGVQQQLEAMYGSGYPGSPFDHQVDQLKRRFRLTRDPYEVNCYTPRSWAVQASATLVSRVEEKTRESENYDSDDWILEIETKKDLEAKFVTLIAQAIANQFGTQIQMFSQNDQLLRIGVGVYSNPESVLGNSDARYRFED